MIVVEGVVGAGKSSLMELINKEFGHEMFREPVVDNPILDKFYHDRPRYAFPLQVFFLNKRFDHLKTAELSEKAVLDRSIYGDAVFAKMLMFDGDMVKEEFLIYIDLLENMLEHVKAPTLLIYLELSTDEAIRRINKRGRDYEKIVEKEYWESLNEQYTLYFNKYDKSPVLTINVDNLDFVANKEDETKILDLIRIALSELENPSK